jgi:cyanate permease
LLVAISVSLVGLSGLIGLSNYESLVASSGIYGLGIGGVAPLQAALLARGFGTRNFGPVMGLMAPLTMPFQVTGPPLAGLIFDTQGSYDMALWIFFATTLLSALAVSWMRLPSHSPDSAADAALPGPRLAESS